MKEKESCHWGHGTTADKFAQAVLQWDAIFGTMREYVLKGERFHLDLRFEPKENIARAVFFDDEATECDEECKQEEFQG